MSPLQNSNSVNISLYFHIGVIAISWLYTPTEIKIFLRWRYLSVPYLKCSQSQALDYMKVHKCHHRIMRMDGKMLLLHSYRQLNEVDSK